MSKRAHDRTGADTRVKFVKRRLAVDTVLPMHPDRWWACAVSRVPPQNAVNFSPLFECVCVALFY